MQDAVASSAALVLLRARLLAETGRAALALERLAASAAYRAGSAPHCALAGILRRAAGAYGAAEADLRRGLESDRASIEARTELGLLLIERGRRAEGEAALEEVIDIYKGLSGAATDKLQPEAFVWFGRACEGLNRFREAYDVMYSQALDLDAANLSAHVASGKIMFEKYNYPDSRSHFRDALKRNPRHAEAQIGLARATNADRQYPRPDERQNVIDEALAAVDAVSPDHPDALMLRGDIAFAEEAWGGAERFYRQAIAANPVNLARQGALGALFYATARLDEFAALEQEVAKLHPRPALFYGEVAARLVDRFFYREAAEFARKAIELDAGHWPAYATLGINALRTGQNEEGRKFLEKSITLDPFNVWASNTNKLVRHMDANFSEVATPNFVIRMNRADMPFMLPYLQPLLEDAKVRMERDYKVALELPIFVEDFSKHELFSARSIGLPGLAASGVCFGRMVTLTTPRAIPGNWGAVAVHEFAHVIHLQKSAHRLPRWFGEGLSVFEEGRAQPHWVRRYADEFVVAAHNGVLLPIGRLQRGFMKPEGPWRILLSYFQGGVICRYIVERWGFDKINAMLDEYRAGGTTDRVFQEVLGISLEEFDEVFFAYAKKLGDSWGLAPLYGEPEIPALKRRVAERPDDGETWIKLGLAYLFTDKVADAELAIGKAMTSAPAHPDLLALRGLLGLKQKKNQPALRDLERAVETNTRYLYLARVALGLLCRAEQNRARAIEHLQQAIALHEGGTRRRFGAPNPYYQLAELLNADGRVAEAIEVLEKLRRNDRDDLNVRLTLAKHYFAAEEWGKLVAALADAPYIDPFVPEPHRFLAKGFVEVGAWESALRELNVLLEFPNPPLEEIYPDLAWCHFKLGEHAKARSFAERALQMAPNNERAKEVMKSLP